MDLFSYAVGRSSGRSSAEYEYSRELDSANASIRALNKRVRTLEADLAVIEPNRDDLARQAWELHYELEQAKKDIDRLRQALNEARQEINERVAEVESVNTGVQIWRQWMQDSIWFSRFLLAAAEAGKSDRAEYQELKTMVHDMNETWIILADDSRDDPAFQQRLNELVESLRR